MHTTTARGVLHRFLFDRTLRLAQIITRYYNRDLFRCLVDAISIRTVVLAILPNFPEKLSEQHT